MVDDHFDREHRYLQYMYQSKRFFHDLEREFSVDRTYVVRSRVHELTLEYRSIYPNEKDHYDHFRVCMLVEHFHQCRYQLLEV